MSMDIFINYNDNGWWSSKTGIFECIVEETRSPFKDSEHECLKTIYLPYDEWYQGYIDLRHVDEKCFNLFYSYCMQAMSDFSNSERSKILDKEFLPVILFQWSAVLMIMRDDSRYRGQQESK